MSLDQAKHKTVLVRILKDFYSHPGIGPVLGFKGGTAAYLFYDLDRFSVDLDFDLLDAGKENYVFEEVKSILQKFGKLKAADNKRFNLIYILDYDERELAGQKIKVEINKRNFGSKYEVKSYLGIPIKVMTKEYMLTNKLVAMYERIGKTNRDIYDAWFFLSKGWLVNQELVEKRTNMGFKDFINTCLDLLKKMNNKNILSGMGELLNEKQKAWVKTKLLDELAFQLELYLKVNT
jgi:predicted nucleotidyltransferase component of viral defense system